MVVSTLDPAYTQSSITLSNGNLTGTTNGGGPSQQSGLATTILTPDAGTGKWYWEGMIGGNNTAILLGFGNDSADLTTYCGHDTNSVGVTQVGAAYYNNSNFANTGENWGIPSSNAIGFAVDLINKKFWIIVNGRYWNNDPTANPATNTGGYDISALVTVNSSIRPMYTLSASGASYTVNLGATPFVAVLPSGFQAADTWAPAPPPVQPPYFKNAFFDSTYLGTNVTLSGNNLTCNATGSDAFRVALTTPEMTSGQGKWYWEVVSTTDDCGIGIANTSVNLNNYGGSDANGLALNDVGQVYYNGSIIGTGPRFLTNNVICVALDLVNKKIWFRSDFHDWNADPTANPSTNTGGIDISALLTTSPNIRPMIYQYSGGAVSTACFGIRSFKEVVPSGFYPVSIDSFGHLLLSLI